MRRVRYQVAGSLDGFIAGPDETAALHTYLRGLRGLLQSDLIAVYVNGSATLGDFRSGRSDIDLVIAATELEPSDMRRLLWLHRRMELRLHRPRLSGIYVVVDRDAGTHHVATIVREGRAHAAKDARIDAITSYELATTAATLHGPPPADLGIADAAAGLRRYTIDNTREYWTPWVQRAARATTLDGVLLCWRAAHVEWVVLGLCRQLFTLAENTVVSKYAAGEYVLRTAPARFRPIVAEALRIRTGMRGGEFPTRAARKRAALDFARYAIESVRAA